DSEKVNTQLRQQLVESMQAPHHSVNPVSSPQPKLSSKKKKKLKHKKNQVKTPKAVSDTEKNELKITIDTIEKTLLAKQSGVPLNKNSSPMHKSMAFGTSFSLEEVRKKIEKKYTIKPFDSLDTDAKLIAANNVKIPPHLPKFIEYLSKQVLQSPAEAKK